MLCYKDMTFCYSNCVNRQCSRHFGEEQQAGAKRWLGSDGAPVSFSDFSNTCEAYEEPAKQLDENNG